MVTVLSPSLSATCNGAGLHQILSASAHHGWKLPYPDATIYVPRVPAQTTTTWAPTTAYASLAAVKPTSRNGHVYHATVAGTSGATEPTWPTGAGATVTDGTVTWQEIGADVVYNDVVQLTMGAGTHSALRFYGYVRRKDYRLWPRAVGLVCYGRLVLAAQYENSEDPETVGGLLLADFAGSASPTDQAVVQQVLTKAGVPYTAANIAGTGVTFGATADPRVFLWSAGSQYNSNGEMIYQAQGEMALDYIHRWDAVSAVWTSNTAAAGFYRTYETPNGVYRALIGGRPRGTADFTFQEGLDADILDGQGSREYPIANRVLVIGYDDGQGAGPVTNQLSTTIQSSNDFMPNTEKHTYTLQSPFIEQALIADVTSNDGMSCETAANALMLDVNRETVSLRFRTGRDDLINPGATVLVQAAGGLPDRLGIGENLWVDEVTVSIDEQGRFRQELVCTGGGLPDSYTAAPPG